MVKSTRQKEVILRILKSTNMHPTADWVYSEARKEISNISLGTVYRNLKVLCINGEILELDICGSSSRFDGNPVSHYHFRCETCGRIFDVDEPVNRALDVKVARKTGFEVLYHRIEFRGLCTECKE